jgi:ABC-type polar amino acid transport system ATPase subunit
MLCGKNIEKSFGKNEVLHDINVTMEPGKITAIIGPSGSGKSTLLRALSLLDPPDSGSVIIDSTTYSFPLLSKKSFTLPWPKVSVVFQQLFLWPHLTLHKNLTLPIRKNEKLVAGDHVDKLIDLFDLRDCIHRYPNEASLGQRQRAALLRSLLLDPQYLLLDEITSALDVEQVSIVLQHLQKLRDQGMAIMLITHLIGFARRAADQIIFIEDGRIIEIGGPEILDSPSNKRLRTFLALVESTT